MFITRVFLINSPDRDDDSCGGLVNRVAHSFLASGVAAIAGRRLNMLPTPRKTPDLHLLPVDDGPVDFGEGPASGQFHRHLKFPAQNPQRPRHSGRSSYT